MQYKNSFCVAENEEIFVENHNGSVKNLTVLCHDALFAAKMLKKYQMSGTIVLPSEIALKKGQLEKAKSYGFDVRVFVDLVDCDEKTLEKVSLLAYPTVIPLFDNLQKTGEIAARYEKSPAHVLEDFGFLDRACFILGGEYADKDDLVVLASGKDTTIVVCPRDQALKGSTFANIVLMQKCGLKVELGTWSQKNIDMEKEIEFLFLTTLSLFENKQISKSQIQKLAQGD